MRLTVDAVIFGYVEIDLKLLLIKRKYEPFKDMWALPGGYVLEEGIDAAIKREVFEETGIEDLYLEQLYTFGELERDPRGQIVTVAYYGLVKPSDYKLHASSDAEDVQWFSVKDLPQDLAFDHNIIIDTALQRLKGKVRYMPIGFELLPKKFPFSSIQNLYETILEQEFDRRNFRKKFLKLDILDMLDEKQQNVAHKAGNLFMFNEEKYNKKTEDGFYFEI
jgi:8-oxo-dGTP diphosphatase